VVHELLDHEISPSVLLATEWLEDTPADDLE
jgi:hypothetical protein